MVQVEETDWLRRDRTPQVKRGQLKMFYRRKDGSRIVSAQISRGKGFKPRAKRGFLCSRWRRIRGIGRVGSEFTRRRRWKSFRTK
ncbi:hypothetical protein C2845_PM17G07520 [Panicum miliaceum]|uniref:Uncharacterized protein n=1 Tax=Panicum miliaceum TaxID=4540 RepID=A0A3L6Q2Z5_PANMI|nr:hypothetical protein C2845_PM17G07520 [Panicum miliaceum]